MFQTNVTNVRSLLIKINLFKTEQTVQIFRNDVIQHKCKNVWVNSPFNFRQH